jgi:Flp pilus assembly protein TadG
MPQATKRFAKDEKGTATIAFVLWVQMFFLILFFTLDVTLSLVAHSRMWDVARNMST